MVIVRFIFYIVVFDYFVDRFWVRGWRVGWEYIFVGYLVGVEEVFGRLGLYV